MAFHAVLFPLLLHESRSGTRVIRPGGAGGAVCRVARRGAAALSRRSMRAVDCRTRWSTMLTLADVSGCRHPVFSRTRSGCWRSTGRRWSPPRSAADHTHSTWYLHAPHIGAATLGQKGCTLHLLGIAASGTATSSTRKHHRGVEEACSGVRSLISRVCRFFSATSSVGHGLAR